MLQAAEGALDDLSSPLESTPIWNVEGYAPLLDHARSLIDATREQLLVAVWPEEARALAAPLAQAEARGVAVITLCLTACPTPCGGCRGPIYSERTAPESSNRWLVLVPDAAEVLAGEIGPREETLAVRTHQGLLVELVSGYIRHSIALATVLHDLGTRGDDVLDPATHATLAALGASQPNAGWLEHMRRLLRTGRT
jgi:hypothetical protein